MFYNITKLYLYLYIYINIELDILILNNTFLYLKYK